jgi:hypothetical protein
MAYQKHALVSIIGKWNTTDLSNEVWQVGIRVSTHAAAGWWLANPATYMAAIKPGIQTWFNSTAIFPNSASLSLLKVNNINTDGTYVGPTTNVTTLVATGGGSAAMPAFVTLAATLETGITLGAARRGRIYLPTAIPVASSKGVTCNSADRDSLRAKVKDLLTILLINEPTGGALVQPGIYSKIGSAVNDINGVSVNDVFDVQRRRKNRAAGTRSTILAFP